MELEKLLIIVFSILIVIYCAIRFIWYFKKFGYIPTIKMLFEKAEEIFKYKDNANKNKYVVDFIYNSIPAFFKTVITRENVNNFVELVYKDFKKELDKIINSSGGTNE